MATRRPLLLTLLVVLATACTPAAEPADPGGATASPLPGASAGDADEQPSTAPSDAPDDAQDGDGQDTGGQDGGDGDGTAPEDDGPSEDPEPTEAEQPQLTELTNRGPTGTNGPAYLRGDRSRVVVEVDAQDGVSLPDSVLDHVRSVLSRESNASVEVVRQAATSAERDTWTVEQLSAAAQETRTVAHGDDVAVIHLLVLSGEFEREGSLGVAFDASTAAVFPDQWNNLTTLLSSTTIARAVTTHEVGHLLGLVGLAQEPVNDHEDPEHPGHTTDEDDVMYWAVETDLIGTLDGVPDDFGPLTRADLQAMREG